MTTAILSLKRSGQPVGAELLPGDALQRRRQLALDAAVLQQAAQREQEQHEDREHGEAEDPAAAAALEGEEAQDRVQDVGGRDERERERRREQQQDVAVAQRASGGQTAKSDQAGREAEAEDSEGGELHRARGRIARRQAGTAAASQAIVTPASAMHERHQRQRAARDGQQQAADQRDAEDREADRHAPPSGAATRARSAPPAPRTPAPCGRRTRTSATSSAEDPRSHMFWILRITIQA